MLRSRRSSVTEPYFVAIPKEERYQVKFRDLKEMYVQFNSRNGGNPLLARNEIKDLIQKYKSSRFEIFRDFASLLEKFENPIVNSFIMVFLQPGKLRYLTVSLTIPL